MERTPSGVTTTTTIIYVFIFPCIVVDIFNPNPGGAFKETERHLGALPNAAVNSGTNPNSQ